MNKFTKKLAKNYIIKENTKKHPDPKGVEAQKNCLVGAGHNVLTPELRQFPSTGSATIALLHSGLGSQIHVGC